MKPIDIDRHYYIIDGRTYTYLNNIDNCLRFKYYGSYQYAEIDSQLRIWFKDGYERSDIYKLMHPLELPGILVPRYQATGEIIVELFDAYNKFNQIKLRDKWVRL